MTQDLDPRPRTSGHVADGSLDARASGELANLDILRALAVLCVFVSHVPTWRATAYACGFNMGLVGVFGVSIFFVHTALVLQSSLARLGRATSQSATYRTFIIRRVFRVYPLSVVAVLAVAGLAQLGAWPKIGAFALATNLLLIQNIFGTVSAPETLWSLPFEMQMYFLLPFLFDLVQKSPARAPRLLLVAWAALVLGLLLLVTLGGHWAFSIFQRAKFGAHFIPGVIAYALFQRPEPSRLRSPWLLLAALALGILVLPFFVGIAEPGATIAQWCVCLTLGLMIPRCRDSALSIVNRFAHLIARYSYGIYLVHHPVILLVYHDNSPVDPALRFALVAVATAALSFLSYHLLEEPFIRIGKRLGRPLVR